MADEDALIFDRLKQRKQRLEKPIPVELAGVGRIYVRPRFFSEKNAHDDAVKAGDSDAVAWGLTRLLCRASGERLSNDDRERYAEAFADLTEADIVAISDAVDSGNTKGDDPGN